MPNTLQRIDHILRFGLNAAIVLLCLILCIEAASSFHKSPNGRHDQQNVGERLDWLNIRKEKRIVLVALQAGCPFCAQSAPFYKRLIASAHDRKDMEVVAIMPSSPRDSEAYLKNKEMPFSNVLQEPLGHLRIKGTPTLLLVDANGIVLHSWVGLLNDDAQREVLDEISH